MDPRESSDYTEVLLDAVKNLRVIYDRGRQNLLVSKQQYEDMMEALMKENTPDLKATWGANDDPNRISV